MAALDGILVVALEQAVAAPLCTSRLCDAGARVIKVERREGDFARFYDRFAHGDSSYFTWLNQGKESATLDLRAPADAALLMNMVRHADVFVQNLAPGAADRLGFDDERLAAANPSLIRCHISGYGGDGDGENLKAYDLPVQAEAGLIAVSGAPGHPGRIGVSVCDIATGMAAHGAILEALIERRKTGLGKDIHLSLFGTMTDWMTVPLMQFDATGSAPTPVGLAHPSIAPYEGFDTADGKSILIAIQNDREWAEFCNAVLESPDVATDTRFARNTDRVENRDALHSMIGRKIGKLTAKEAMSLLTESGVACGRINDASAVASHPALTKRSIANCAGEPVEIPALPVTRPTSGDRYAPRLGEHTKALFDEFRPRQD